MAVLDFQFRDTAQQAVKRLRLNATQASTSAPATNQTPVNNTGTSYTWARTGTGVYTLTADTLAAVPFTDGYCDIQLSFGGTAVTGKVVRTSSTVLTFSFGDGATPSAADLVGTLFLSVDIYPAI